MSESPPLVWSSDSDNAEPLGQPVALSLDHNDVEILASQVPQRPAPALPAPTAHQRQVEQDRQLGKLRDLGFTGNGKKLTLRLENSEELDVFMKKKSFIQKGGTSTTLKGHYNRLRCCNWDQPPPLQCPFTLHAYFLEGGGYDVKTTEAPLKQWHAEGCDREAKGQHGLTAAEKKIALENKPRVAVLKVRAEIQKKEHGAESVSMEGQENEGSVEGPQNIDLGGVTHKKMRNARFYASELERNDYDTKPQEYIGRKFPNCIVTRFTVENVTLGRKITVHTVTRPWLLSLALMCDGGKVYSDATYWVVKKHGHLVTIGVEMHKSFVPVFAAISEGHDEEKAPENEEHLAHIFTAFKNSIYTLLQLSWTPTMLIRDHACAFINACRLVFGENVTDAVCYFHVEQALEEHLKKHVQDVSLRKEMHELTKEFRSCTLEEYRHSLRLAQKDLVAPVWKKYFSFQRAARRDPDGANRAWVGTFEDNCGIERWHRTLQEAALIRGYQNGHLCVRGLVEMLCVLFTQNEEMLNTTTPRLYLPVYFESREATERERARNAERDSVPFQMALEIAGGGPAEYMTSVGILGARVIGALEVGRMQAKSETSFIAWREFRAVYRVTSSSCTCSDFVVHRICPHQVGMKNYVKANDIAESPEPRRAVLPGVLLGDVTNTQRARELTPNAREKPADYLTPPPHVSWDRPAKRPKNALQQMREASNKEH